MSVVSQRRRARRHGTLAKATATELRASRLARATSGHPLQVITLAAVFTVTDPFGIELWTPLPQWLAAFQGKNDTYSLDNLVAAIVARVPAQTKATAIAAVKKCDGLFALDGEGRQYHGKLDKKSKRALAAWVPA